MHLVGWFIWIEGKYVLVSHLDKCQGLAKPLLLNLIVFWGFNKWFNEQWVLGKALCHKKDALRNTLLLEQWVCLTVPHKFWEPPIMQVTFVDIHSISVSTAELPICWLEFLGTRPRKLFQQNVTQCVHHRCHSLTLMQTMKETQVDLCQIHQARKHSLQVLAQLEVLL